MQLSSTPRIEFLRGLVAEIAHNYGRGRTLVAVDGGAGTASFADDLATVFREARHTAFRDESPESYYREAFDYRTLRRVLIDPFRMAGSTGFQTSAFDERRDAPTQSRWLTAPADAVLIIDGVFLNRPELRDLWNFSILLEDPGVPADGLERYFAETDARAQASAIVDIGDPDAPRRIFTDSC
jgi:uridine kinase